MDKIWFLKFNGIFYCKVGRMTSYFTPSYVKRNQRLFNLVNKHRLFGKGNLMYLYNYI